MNTDLLPAMLTVDEVAIYLRVSTATVYRMANAGKIPCVKVGRSWRFARSAIDRWAAQQPAEGTTSAAQLPSQ